MGEVVMRGRGPFWNLTIVDFSDGTDDPKLQGIVMQDLKMASCYHASYPLKNHLGEFYSKNAAIRAIRKANEEGVTIDEDVIEGDSSDPGESSPDGIAAI